VKWERLALQSVLDGSERCCAMDRRQPFRESPFGLASTLEEAGFIRSSRGRDCSPIGMQAFRRGMTSGDQFASDGGVGLTISERCRCDTEVKPRR